MALDLLSGQANHSLEVAQISLLEQLVAEHGAKRGRQRHRQPESDLFLGQPPHHTQERQIGFGDGFEEPVFLEKILVLRMPDEWQMRVQDERERTGHKVSGLSVQVSENNDSEP